MVTLADPHPPARSRSGQGDLAAPGLPGATTDVVLPPLYALLDVATLVRLRLAGPRHVLHLDAAPLADAASAAAARLVADGVRLLQVRLTGLGLDPVGALRVATAVVRAAHAGASDALVVVNDDPALALRAGADGVHLGARDPRPDRARALMGPAAVIGASVRDPAVLPVADADYLGTGPVRATSTKAGLPDPIGFDGLAAVVAAARGVPVYAIGGLGPADAPAALAAGAHGVVMGGGLLQHLARPEGAAAAIAAFGDAWRAAGRPRRAGTAAPPAAGVGVGVGVGDGVGGGAPGRAR